MRGELLTNTENENMTAYLGEKGAWSAEKVSPRKNDDLQDFSLVDIEDVSLCLLYEVKINTIFLFER